MLVLSRRIGESIEIGQGVFVSLLEIKKGKARIGIDAPMSVNVRRTEVPPVSQPGQVSGTHRETEE